ncbi:MAG: hypothetical protein GY856_44940 [bacterium]|nr:hypothetical protein [bacterium]
MRNHLPTFSLIFALLFSLLLGGSADAAVNKWTSQGPFAGAVRATVVDPLDEDIVYIGVDGNGVFKSTDAGINWTDVGVVNGLTDPRVRALAFDNQVPANLYAGTNGGGVFKTTDGGASWTAVNGTDPTALANPFVLSLVTDPDIDGLLYAGTNGGGVFKSLDGGLSWTEKNFGLGNRVIFDLAIPRPLAVLVINEVDAVSPADLEFVELFGPPNLSLQGKVLVFFELDVFYDLVSYAAYDLDGYALDNNGLFAVGEPGVPNVDWEDPAFDLDDNAAAVGLYYGDDIDFPPGTTPPDPDVVGLIDAVGHHTSDSNGDCAACIIVWDCGLACSYPDDFPPVNENGRGLKEFDSIARYPDGGLRLVTTSYIQTGPGALVTGPTPGTRNKPLKEIYAATDLEGVFRSLDRGETWVPLTNGLTSEVVFTIAIDPVDPDIECPFSSYTAYVGTSAAGIFKSTDPCELDLEEDWMPAGLTEETVLSLAVAPVVDPLSAYNSVLYAGTELGAVYKSVDNAGSWAEHSNGLGGLSVEALEVNPFLNVFEDPLRPSTIYAGTGGGGVFKSVDSASNWFASSLDLDGAIGVFCEDVAVHPSDPLALWVATFGGGIFKSNDGGLSWSSSSTGLGSIFVLSIAIDPDNPAILYAGTDLAGLYKSIDGGANWAASNTGLADPPPGVFEILVDPTAPTTIYLATGGLYKSLDSGANWTAIDADFGDSFVQTIVIDPQTPNILYAGTLDAGVFKSTNGGTGAPPGNNWTPSNTGLTEQFIRALAVDPDDPETIFAGTDGGGVFRSLNGGDVWIPRNNGFPPSVIVLDLAINPEDPNIMYAGTEGADSTTGGMFKTLDGASNWSPYNTGLTNYIAKDVEFAPLIAPDNLDILYVATFGGGVFDFRRVERFEIIPTTGLITSEVGGIDTFTVNLKSVPNANVTLAVTSADLSEGTVDPESLLFTPGTALDPQTVTVTGVPDTELDGDVAFLILTETAVSLDTDFSGVDPDDVSVVNLDDIVIPPGITVDPTSGLVVNEAGGSATFNVVLRTAPTADVEVPVACADSTEAVVDPTSLTFTALDYDEPQAVTITGIDDGAIDGDQLFTVTVGPATGGAEYSGVIGSDVFATNRDLGAEIIFETATLGTTGATSGGYLITSTIFLGAKFDLPQAVTVTTVGGHLLGISGDPSLFVAIVPLVGTPPNDFPANFSLNTAVFSETFSGPSPSAEFSISTGADYLDLPAGSYALVFGSGRFGATGTGRMPGTDINIGSPEYFYADVTQPIWLNGTVTGARFFVNGGADVNDFRDDIFADGFESGDVSAWSSSVP